MSSLDSSTNSLATVSVNDVYRRFVRNMFEQSGYWLALALTTLYGVFGTTSALCVATNPRDEAIFEPYLGVLGSLGLVGGGLAASYALGTCAKCANGAGVAAGALAVIILRLQTIEIGNFMIRAPEIPFLTAFVAFTTCFAVGYIISLALPTLNK